MPLQQPSRLREKILLIGPGKTGKSSAWLSIAWWAFKSGDQRRFFVLDTDDEAILQVMNEPKYAGMLAEDGGNVEIHRAVEWEDYTAFSEHVIKEAKEGDWIVIDFITHAWSAVQESWLQNEVKKTRSEALLEAAREGATGWDLFKVDFNWPVINAMYFDFIKPINIRSRAHLFFVAEQDEINESARKLPADQKEHLREFGAFKAKGQKGLVYSCRSYLRIQKLARGRVLFTLGDRARKVLDGDDLGSDFFQGYLKSVAGWAIESPPKEVTESKGDNA